MTAVQDDVAPPEASAHRPRGPSAEMVSIAGVVLLGIVARAVLVQSRLGYLNSDEATTGLQGIELWRGRAWVFVPGNIYGGNADTWLAAPFEALLPASVLRLKILASVTWLAAAALVYLATRRRTGTGPALVAAAVIWVPSAALLQLSTSAYPGYASGLLAAAGVAAAAGALDDGPARARTAFLLGALAGLAIWQHPLFVYAVIPFAAWVAWRHRRSLAIVGSIAAGGAIGVALPVYYNLRHDLVSVRTRPVPPNGYGARVRDWAGDLLPRAAGAKWLDDEWVLGALGRPVLVLAGTVLAALALVVVVRGHGHARVAAAMALAAPVALPYFEGAWFTRDARYAIVALVPLAVALAHGLSLVRGRLAPAVAAGAVAAWAVVAIAVPFALRLDDVTGDLSAGEVAGVLEEHGVTRVRADYWLAYQLTYETDEAIVASPIFPVRFGYYERLVRQAEADGAAALVLFDDQVHAFLAGAPGYEGQQAFRASSRVDAGRFTIFLPPEPEASP